MLQTSSESAGQKSLRTRVQEEMQTKVQEEKALDWRMANHVRQRVRQPQGMSIGSCSRKGLPTALEVSQMPSAWHEPYMKVYLGSFQGDLELRCQCRQQAGGDVSRTVSSEGPERCQ